MNKVYLYIILIILAIYLFNRYYVGEVKVVLKDHMEPSDSNVNCEEKTIDSDYEKAWTDENVSKNTKYHTSHIKDEKTDTGAFFNSKKEFVDITSYKSKDMIPEKCFMENGELKCEFNNKLQIIPPRLIEDPEKNQLLLSIGDDKNINTNVMSKDVFSFNGNTYNVWNYGEKEKETEGYNLDSKPQSVLDMKKNYAL
jgi:hypothetical protein